MRNFLWIESGRPRVLDQTANNVPLAKRLILGLGLKQNGRPRVPNKAVDPYFQIKRYGQDFNPGVQTKQ